MVFVWFLDGVIAKNNFQVMSLGGFVNRFREVTLFPPKEREDNSFRRLRPQGRGPPAGGKIVSHISLASGAPVSLARRCAPRLAPPPAEKLLLTLVLPPVPPYLLHARVRHDLPHRRRESRRSDLRWGKGCINGVVCIF